MSVFETYRQINKVGERMRENDGKCQRCRQREKEKGKGKSEIEKDRESRPIRDDFPRLCGAEFATLA